MAGLTYQILTNFPTHLPKLCLITAIIDHQYNSYGLTALKKYFTFFLIWFLLPYLTLLTFENNRVLLQTCAFVCLIYNQLIFRDKNGGQRELINSFNYIVINVLMLVEMIGVS